MINYSGFLQRIEADASGGGVGKAERHSRTPSVEFQCRSEQQLLPIPLLILIPQQQQQQQQQQQ